MKTLSRAQVRELDRRAIEEYGVPGIVLMENAGRGAAEVLMRLNPTPEMVAIYCGQGNNGGDGFVMARHLENQGWNVRLVCARRTGLEKGDAAIMADIAFAGGIRRPLCSRDVHWKWIVDAVFGTGLTGPAREPFDKVISSINKGREAGKKVLALDIPSGLDCDTGKPLGPCVRADHTVTFVAPKAGFANPESREWTGEVHVVGIGAPRVLLEQYGL